MNLTETMHNAAADKSRGSGTKKRLGQLGKKVKSIDMFGQGVGFKIGGGKATHQTYFGSLFTLFVIVITGTYAFKRYTVMSGYEDTVFQTQTEL